MTAGVASEYVPEESDATPQPEKKPEAIEQTTTSTARGIYQDDASRYSLENLLKKQEVDHE